jgi:SPP1 family predicted phage head-tail adaptor
MQAGQLRHRVRVDRPSYSQTATGEPVISWVEAATVWAAVVPTSGREYYMRDQTRDEVDTAILMRWSPQLAEMGATWKVVFKGVEYDVQSVMDADLRNSQLRVFAKRKTQEHGGG